MQSSRRHFLETTGLVFGAASLSSWDFAAEAAVAAAIDKDALAALAISRAKKLGASYADIRINRYRYESVFAREQQVQTVSRTQSISAGQSKWFRRQKSWRVGKAPSIKTRLRSRWKAKLSFCSN